eukprot:4133095-Amphidinium_carterae.1
MKRGTATRQQVRRAVGDKDTQRRKSKHARKTSPDYKAPHIKWQNSTHDSNFGSSASEKDAQMSKTVLAKSLQFKFRTLVAR